ncbi:unnamed protein product, partial [Cylicostephanus goldi]
STKLEQNYPQYSRNIPYPALPPPRSRKPQVFPATNFFCLACIFALVIPSAVAQTFQICGITQYAHVLPFPEPVACHVAPSEAMVRTKVQLYNIKNDPLQLAAVKCYMDIIEVSVYNILYIRTTYSIIDRLRLPISAEDCRTAKTIYIIRGHYLHQVTIYMTSEIEDMNTSLPLWGTTIQMRSLYSMEIGEVAVLMVVL